MGELLTGVQRGKIPNPFSRRFDLERWRELRSFDDADMRVQDAGVIVFALLEALRPNLKVGAPSISRARALCAHANQHLVQLHQSFIQAVAQLPSPSIDLEQVLDTKMAITGATLGETTDALGDSYVYPLREAINGLTNFNERLSRSEIGKLLEETFHEIHVANQWYLIWFFWTDVLWTGGRLRSTPEGNLELSRDDMFSETIRQIGVWRRSRQAEALSSLVSALSIEGLHSASLMLPKVTRAGDKFVLMLRRKRPEERSWSERIAGFIVVTQELVTRQMLDVSLSLNGTTVLVSEAIRFYSSLLTFAFDLLDEVPDRKIAHLNDAIKLTFESLVFVLSRLCDLDERKARALVDYATFTGQHNESLWGRPLVSAGGGACFVFTPALKSNPARVINDLIDAHSTNPSEKGRAFEAAVRQKINESLAAGPYRDVGWVCPSSIPTSVGDIDVCVILGSTLLLIETKFIGNAIDAYEFARADEILAKGVTQAKANAQAVSSNRAAFISSLAVKFGPTHFERIKDIVPMVVTSDAYHAGFPIDGVFVADIPILHSYLSNHFDTKVVVSSGRVSESTVQLYETAEMGLGLLEEYFARPEIIKRATGRLRPRRVSYPLGIQRENGQVVVELPTFEVGPKEDS